MRQGVWVSEGLKKEMGAGGGGGREGEGVVVRCHFMYYNQATHI